ncbi:hypothetical protein D043_0458B, partial [Vibrio parahaemolyticus EKP-021]
QQLRALLLLLL